MDEQSQSYMVSLPAEMIHYICDFMDDREYSYTMMTCKKINYILGYDMSTHHSNMSPAISYELVNGEYMIDNVECTRCMSDNSCIYRTCRDNRFFTFIEGVIKSNRGDPRFYMSAHNILECIYAYADYVCTVSILEKDANVGRNMEYLIDTLDQFIYSIEPYYMYKIPIINSIIEQLDRNLSSMVSCDEQNTILGDPFLSHTLIKSFIVYIYMNYDLHRMYAIHYDDFLISEASYNPSHGTMQSLIENRYRCLTENTQNCQRHDFTLATMFNASVCDDPIMSKMMRDDLRMFPESLEYYLHFTCNAITVYECELDVAAQYLRLPYVSNANLKTYVNMFSVCGLKRIKTFIEGLLVIE